MSIRTILLALALLVLGAVGCATASPPDFAQLYDRAAQDHHPARNPVIVIPGVLGSRLVDASTGEIVWGAFTQPYADPRTAAGARKIALPMREGAPLHALRDAVVANGVLDRVEVRLFGLPLQLQQYAPIMQTLGVGGYRDEFFGRSGSVDYGDDHFTCFQFPYDWRRDLAEAAADLDRFIREKRAYVQRELERRYGVRNADVKFDLVAHSMGGLLTRYYLRYGGAALPTDGALPPVTWAGAAHVERAVLVAPPNAGSLTALLDMTRGVWFGPTLPTYQPAVLGTMPSVYQMLPRGRHRAVVDAADRRIPITNLYDPGLWEQMGWGLAAPDQDAVLRMLLPDAPDPAARRRVALDHLRKSLARAEQFTAALDRPATAPEHLRLYLIASDAVETDAVAALHRNTGALEVIARHPGDGTVLRSSALMDERLDGQWTPYLRSPIDWHSVMFLFTDHLGLTKAPEFTDNVLYVLLESPH